MFIKGITIEICMWDWFNGTEAKRNGYMVLIIGFIFVNKLKMDFNSDMERETIDG